jgi:hypothetical protein
MTTGMVDAGEEPVRGEKRLLASLVVKLGNVLVWRNHFSKKNGEVSPKLNAHEHMTNART